MAVVGLLAGCVTPAVAHAPRAVATPVIPACQNARRTVEDFLTQMADLNRNNPTSTSATLQALDDRFDDEFTAYANACPALTPPAGAPVP